MDLKATLDSKGLEDKLKIFSSGLGNIYQQLLEEVGKEMSAAAASKAPFRTGKLKSNVKFIFDKKDNIGALTTRKNLTKGNIWYAKFVEYGANIKAKNKDYLMFKINGEWKKVKSVTLKPKPFMTSVWEEYFGSSGGKGYTSLAAALERKINEKLN